MCLLYVSVLIVLAICPATGVPTDCVVGEYKIIPKLNCRGFYMCVNGQPVEMPDCPKGSVFSQTAHVCVPENSIYNDCQLALTPPKVTSNPSTDNIDSIPALPDLGPLSIEEKCQMFGGVYPHPTQCQAYYNCSRDDANTDYAISLRYPEKYMLECSYPNLFNAETKQCDKFENVKCGNRVEYTNACDYARNRCPVAHCIPCPVLFPNCDGKPDGMAPHEYKLWSPYYTICYKQRTSGQETCPLDVNARTQLFHPDLNKCVSLDLIPREHGGLMPNCSGKANGNHADEFGRCNQYTVCDNRSLVGTVRCKDGELFDSLFQICVEASKTCGPCGNRTDC